MKIGDLFLRVVADLKGFSSDVNFQAAKAGDKAGATLGKSLSASIKKGWTGENIGKGLVQGLGLAGGLGAANALAGGLSAVRDGIAGSISDASDLNETMSKSTVIFGDSADEIASWGSQADTSLGLSKNAAIGAAAGFGNLFKNLGETDAKSAAMSKRIVQLAGDLASFNNLDPTEVLEKLRSGLSGEAEPLRAVGVFLTEAKVKAKAAQLGLADAHGELSEGAKVLARYQLILDETTTAQGDFARTADGLANQQRILNAEMENTSATLGQKLIPLVIGFQKAVLYALDRTSISLDELRNAAARGSQGAAAQLHQLEAVAKEMGISVDAAWTLVNEAGTFSRDVLQANVERMATDVEKMKGSVWTDAGLAGDAIKGIGTDSKTAAGKVTSALDIITDAFSESRRKWTEVGQGAAEAYWDPQIAAADLAATNREIAEQRQIASSKKSTREQVADAKARLLELQKTQLEQLATLASYGDQAAADALRHQVEVLKSTKGLSEDQIAWLKKLEAELDRAAWKARNLGDALRPNRGGDSSRGRAGGGYVPPNWSGSVGEKGTERLTMFEGGGGWVTPHSGAAALGPDIAVPTPTPAFMGSGAAGESASLEGGDTYHTTLNITNPVPHAADEDIGRMLRRLGSLGIRG